MINDENSEYNETKLEWKLRISKDFSLSILHQMLRENLIDLEKAQDRTYLWKVVNDHRDRIIPHLRLIVVLQDEFIQVAKYCVKAKKKATAIILSAVAIEHVINIFYRELLEHKSISEEEITEIIKRTNIDAKLGWLLLITSEISLPADLMKDIKEIIELRNAIIHHKYVAQSSLDENNGSLDAIKPRIEQMDSKKIITIPDELEKIFTTYLNKIDKNREIALELRQVMFESPI